MKTTRPPNTYHIFRLILCLCLAQTQLIQRSTGIDGGTGTARVRDYVFFSFLVCMRFYRRFTLIILLRRSRRNVRARDFRHFLFPFSPLVFGTDERRRADTQLQIENEIKLKRNHRRLHALNRLDLVPVRAASSIYCINILTPL